MEKSVPRLRPSEAPSVREARVQKSRPRPEIGSEESRSDGVAPPARFRAARAHTEDRPATAGEMAEALENTSSPQEAERYLQEHAEDLDALAPDLAELDEADAETLYAALAEAGEGSEVAREQVAGWIERHPEAQRDPRLLEVLTLKSLEGQSAVLEEAAERLPEEPRFQAAAQAAGTYDELITRSTGRDLVATNALLADMAEYPPEVLRPVVDRLADGGVASLLFAAQQGEPDTPEARQALADGLSRLAAGAEDPELTQSLAVEMGRFLRNSQGSTTDPDTTFTDQIGRAFGAAVSEGADAGLAVSLVEVSSGGVSEVLAPHVTDGLEGLYDRVGEVGDRVAELEADLGYLVLNYGPMMSEEELGRAVEDFQAQHPEYAELERLGGGALANLEHLQRLQEATGQEVDLPEAARAAARALPADSAQREVGRLLAREGRGENTWLSDLDAVLGDSEEDQAAREALGGAAFSAGMSEAARVAASGDRARADEILQGIEEAGAVEDLSPEEARGYTNVLRDLLTASADGDLERLAGARDELGQLLDGAGLTDAQRFRLRGAAAVMGLAGVGLAGSQLLDGEATARDWAEFMAAGTEFSATSLEPLLARALGTRGAAAAGGAAVGVGVLFSTVDALSSFSEGDAAQGTLSLTSAVGNALTGVGALGAGAAFTGAGIVLSFSALVGGLALGQFRRVSASNRFESEDTEIFLRHALEGSGLRGEALDDATHQLRNADAEGRLTGVLIQQAAEEVGMAPGDLLDSLASLDPDDLRDLLERGHGIDPQSADLRSLSAAEVREWVDLLYEREVPGLPDRR